MLPSSGLITSQERFQAQMRRFTSMPGMSGDDDEEEEDEEE